MRLLSEPRAARFVVVLIAVFFAGVAVVFAPGAWWQSALLVVPIALFAAWLRWPAVMPLLGVLGPATVVLACLGGDLEPSLFLVALLAFVAAAWEERRPLAWAIVILCILPLVVASLAAPDAGIAWAVWALATGSSSVTGFAVRRLERVRAELARARQDLAGRAIPAEYKRTQPTARESTQGRRPGPERQRAGGEPLEESRRSADRRRPSRESPVEQRRSVDRPRDVHEPAPERRRDAELPGSDLAPAVTQPAPLRRIRRLARTYAARGMHVDIAALGDLDGVEPTQAIAVYHVAQQALADASKHAPDARTSVRLNVTPEAIALIVESEGASDEVGAGRTGRGLASMRKRARGAGGDVFAGPTGRGWSVRCEVPTEPKAPAGARRFRSMRPSRGGPTVATGPIDRRLPS